MMLMTRRRIHSFGITAATSIRYSLTRLRMCHTVCPSWNSATTTFTPSSPESCLKMCSLTKFRTKKSLPYYRWHGRTYQTCQWQSSSFDGLLMVNGRMLHICAILLQTCVTEKAGCLTAWCYKNSLVQCLCTCAAQ